MFALVLIESCCNHFSGVLHTGSKDECEQRAYDLDSDFPQGYHLSVVPVGHKPEEWADVMPIEGVTLNGEPVVPVNYL